MVGTGAAATSPAVAAAGCAVGAAADGAGSDAAVGAQNVAAGRTLAQAIIAGNMAVATEDHIFGFAAAGMAERAGKCAAVTVEAHAHGGRARAVGKGHLGDGGGKV